MSTQNIDFSGTSYNRLESFDWSLRLALSSDKLSGIRKPLLMVKLKTVNGDQKGSLVELDADELSNLLKSLKSAQKATRY